MESILDVQRQTHEELERFERALHTLLSRNRTDHDSAIRNDHKAAQILDRVASRAFTLLSHYQDDHARKKELDLLSPPANPNDLSEFYSRLVKIQEHHAKYPDSVPGGFDLEIAAFLDEPNQDADEDYEEEDRTSIPLLLLSLFCIPCPQPSLCCSRVRKSMENT